jgi:hypothetical protein
VRRRVLPACHTLARYVRRLANSSTLIIRSTTLSLQAALWNTDVGVRFKIERAASVLEANVVEGALRIGLAARLSGTTDWFAKLIATIE